MIPTNDKNIEFKVETDDCAITVLSNLLHVDY